MLALKSLQKGLGKLEVREDILLKDLQESPEVLTEAVQTVLRKNGHADAYEQLKNFSRGQKMSFDDLQNFIESADISAADKKQLKNLTPETYIGLSEELVEQFVK